MGRVRLVSCSHTYLRPAGPLSAVHLATCLYQLTPAHTCCYHARPSHLLKKKRKRKKTLEKPENVKMENETQTPCCTTRVVQQGVSRLMRPAQWPQAASGVLPHPAWEGLWRVVEGCGGLWRVVEGCGGLGRVGEGCGGLWRVVETAARFFITVAFLTTGARGSSRMLHATRD